jgi:hypothetical protein
MCITLCTYALATANEQPAYTTMHETANKEGLLYNHHHHMNTKLTIHSQSAILIYIL